MRDVRGRKSAVNVRRLVWTPKTEVYRANGKYGMMMLYCSLFPLAEDELGALARVLLAVFTLVFREVIAVACTR